MTTESIQINGRPLIWPVPNKIAWYDGVYPLADKISISFEAEFETEAGYLAGQLEEAGIFTLSVSGGGDIKLLMTEGTGLGGEGYTLDVAESGIKIAAESPRGMFYGICSLMQLIINSQRMIPWVSVRDIPFKEIRGVHLYMPDPDNFGWFKRFVDMLAYCKFNTIYLEVGAAMQFESHPECNEAWVRFCKVFTEAPEGSEIALEQKIGFKESGHLKNSSHNENGKGSFCTKEAARGLAEYIRGRHIEVIPEVQSLTHSYWLLLAHPECAERDDDIYPDTACISNPRYYEILFECMEEIIEVFEPKTISIGHDELYNIGLCEKCRERDVFDLMAYDINKMYSWLKERGIKMAMFHDTVLNLDDGSNKDDCTGEDMIFFKFKTRTNEVRKATYRAADMIPSGIMMLDWCDKGLTTQDYHLDRGHTVVYGNFSFCKEYFGEKLRRPGVLGAERSLWRESGDTGIALGFHPYPSSLFGYFEDANVLWYKGVREKKRHIFGEALARLTPMWRDKVNGVRSCAMDGGFECFDISKKFNAPLSRWKHHENLGDVKKIPGTAPFNVDFSQSGGSCIFAGQDGPEIIEGLGVYGSFKSLVFLHAYSIPDPVPRIEYANLYEHAIHREVMGRYFINYIDGSTEEVKIIHGSTIAYSGRIFGAHYCYPIYQAGKTEEAIIKGRTSDTAVHRTSFYELSAYEWHNPKPEAKIKDITLEHDPVKPGGIILYAITGVK